MMTDTTYMKKRKKFSGLLYVRALPNEYLVPIGKRTIKPVLGGKKLKLFQKYMRVPAYVQKLTFVTDNANIDYQGIGIEGYASWRINPDDPKISIATLDFFDEFDPMRKTNEDLKTICIEAVRHVIANMTIEEALKNKDDIAENLKKQLQEVEKKWGIVFDQVGIEQVKIMSDNVFKDLQADFRNKIRQDSETKRINTERVIAKEQNIANENTQTEQIESEKKIDLIRFENEKMKKEKERKLREENFRKDQAFNLEKEQKEHAFSKLKKELELQLNEDEMKLLKSKSELQEVKNVISEKQIAIETLRKELEQMHSDSELSARFIEQLPDIFASVQIDNYSVLEAGSEAGNLSPVTKLLNEIIFSIKNMNFENLKVEKKKE